MPARGDETRTPEADPVAKGTVFYDADCALCRAAVNVVARHDRDGQFRCVPLDAREAAEQLSAEEVADDTLHLVGPAGRQRRSDAVLQLAAGLGGAWRLLGVLRIVPRRWRDAVYDFVARNRRRIFRDGAG